MQIMMRRKLILQVAILLTLAAGPALVISYMSFDWSSWRSAILNDREIRVSDAMKLGMALWIDARSQASFIHSHIPGAFLLSEEHWSRDLELILNAWEPGKPIIVYCDSQTCTAAHNTVKRLRMEVGIDQAWVLRGGWQAWREAQQ
jgi:rhodanese-related sulfurtransferase